MSKQGNGHGHLSALHILHSEVPVTDGGTFVQVRRWQTMDGQHCELVVEHGFLEGDDLVTQSIVAPFHLTAEEALRLIGEGSPAVGANGRKAH
ncbi:MAG: hypothetical protein JSV68_19330 [Anaerolineaceae bacterium]|nr:MAG: hypothetical protein JSV68_19330 [Anaerolineaceae bacterium]